MPGACGPKKKEERKISDHKRLTVRLTTPPSPRAAAGSCWARESGWQQPGCLWAPDGCCPQGPRWGEALGPHAAPPTPVLTDLTPCSWPSAGDTVDSDTSTCTHFCSHIARLHGPGQDTWPNTPGRPNAPGQPSCRTPPASCPAAQRHALPPPTWACMGPGGPISHWSASIPPGSRQASPWCCILMLHVGASRQLKL